MIAPEASPREPNRVRLGCGSAYAEDRLDLAVDLLRAGEVDYLCLDGLAERTLALAQTRRAEDPSAGFDLRMEEFVDTVLPEALDHGTRIVSNMGAANPTGAGEFILRRARNAHLGEFCLAVIDGDECRDLLRDVDPEVLETGRPVSELPGEVVSANAYIGCEPVIEALGLGAQVIIGGRIADPSLFVAPLAHEFGWALDDWRSLGIGTLAGHLLECGAHVTGGNFADPPYRIVPSMRRPGMPLADVWGDGRMLIHKLPGTDGLLSVDTCRAQLAYEVHDPANYLTPDVTADFRYVEVREREDGVELFGADGGPRPDQLKISIGLSEGFVGEGQVSYAGPGALSRARLGEEIVHVWLDDFPQANEIAELRVDYLGLNSMHGAATPPLAADEPYEVHLRVSARTTTARAAKLVGRCVEHVQVYGPAGTSGHRKSVRPLISIFSAFLPRDDVKPTVRLLS
jgi:hypothetical protein